MMEQGVERIFVYGTLRRGASNAHRLQGGRWCAAAVLRGRLYRVSWYPGLVPDEAGRAVCGDLWEVPTPMLAELDAFEGLPPGAMCGAEYERRRVEVEHVDGSRAEAWVWVWRAATESLVELESGDWLEWERDRS